MTFPSLLLLLSFCFLLCLAWLWHLDWSHHGLPHLVAKTAHPMVHRLLKPRTPLDCPACRLASTASSGGRPAPLPVRPWPEVKSRRGAPKQVNTEGFACPNPQCPYCGIIDAHVHALVGDGKHGHGERIQTFRCQVCHTTFTSRRNTPLYHLKTPSQQIAMVLSVLAEGLDPISRPNGSSATVRQPSSLGCPALGSTLRPCTVPFFQLSGWVTATETEVRLYFSPFNHRGMGRDLQDLCRKVNTDGAHLPDGRRLVLTMGQQRSGRLNGPLANTG